MNARVVVIYESARLALADADTFDSLADSMDIADGELRRIRDKLTVQLSDRAARRARNAGIAKRASEQTAKLVAASVARRAAEVAK